MAMPEPTGNGRSGLPPWITNLTGVIRDVGFPIVIALIFVLRIEPAISGLTTSMNWSAYILDAVQKRLEADGQDQHRMREEHAKIFERLSMHPILSEASPPTTLPSRPRHPSRPQPARPLAPSPYPLLD
jgi:hypothetical protein